MSELIDLTGHKFGNLTVERPTSERKNKNVVWKCLCNCGKITYVISSNLNRGNTRSCGCLRKARKGPLNPMWTGRGDLSGNRFYNFERSAKERNLVFEVTIDFLWELFLKQERKCALTGDFLVLEKHAENLGSLDRIDSSKGYTKDNVQWVRCDINYLKQNIKDDHFILLCKKVANYRK